MCPSPAKGRSGKSVLFLFHMGNQSLKRRRQKHELKVCMCVRETERDGWGAHEGGFVGTWEGSGSRRDLNGKGRKDHSAPGVVSGRHYLEILGVGKPLGFEDGLCCWPSREGLPVHDKDRVSKPGTFRVQLAMGHPSFSFLAQLGQ